MRSMLVAGFVVLAVAASARAQPAPDAGGQVDLARLRYQLQVFERVLEQAVQHGAEVIGARWQTETPGMLLFAGPVRARGFWLEGYGVFFDVEVPALRESLTWSFRVLNQGGPGLQNALTMLRRHVESLRDESARAALARALERLEVQVGPVQDASNRLEATAMEPPSAAAPGQAPAPAAPAVDDPVAAYTAAVKDSLIEAILDYTGGLALKTDEWLTVAARDAEARLAPGELYQPATIMLRIKGGDLAAFRAGRLTRTEARSRVEVREF